jgi:hypothetical protein
MNKKDSCKFALFDFTVEGETPKQKIVINTVCELKNENVSDEICENCEMHKSKFIEYPITVNGISVERGFDPYADKIGRMAKIKPCAEAYSGKTYYGVFLGSLQIGSHVSYNETDGTLVVVPHHNPTFYVFELNKIIYGCESFW